MGSKVKNWRECLREKPFYSVLREDIIHCSACSTSFKIAKNARKFCLDSHESSMKYKESLKKWQSPRLKQIPTLDQITNSESNKFFEDLARMLVFCNIPMKKINDPHFKNFTETWCDKGCPDSSSLRKSYLTLIYEQIIDGIKKYLETSLLYSQVGEARFADRKIYCFIIGRLDGERSEHFLLNVSESDVAANHQTIVRFVDDSLRIIWPEDMPHDRVRLMLSDQASDMTKAGQLLKESLFPELLHVTCICHCLSRVCEEVRLIYPDVEKFVTSLKNVLTRRSRRLQIPREKTEATVPSLPIFTRWRTWIEFCKPATCIKDEDCSSVFFLIQSLEKESIRQELQAICGLELIAKTIRDFR